MLKAGSKTVSAPNISIMNGLWNNFLERAGHDGRSVSCCRWGGGCCRVGAAVLTFALVPLAPPSPPSASGLWLQKEKKKSGLGIKLKNTFFPPRNPTSPLTLIPALQLSFTSSYFTLFSLLPSFIWGSSSPSPCVSQPRKQRRERVTWQSLELNNSTSKWRTVEVLVSGQKGRKWFIA